MPEAPTSRGLEVNARTGAQSLPPAPTSSAATRTSTFTYALTDNDSAVLVEFEWAPDEVGRSEATNGSQSALQIASEDGERKDKAVSSADPRVRVCNVRGVAICSVPVPAEAEEGDDDGRERVSYRRTIPRLSPVASKFEE